MTLDRLRPLLLPALAVGICAAAAGAFWIARTPAVVLDPGGGVSRDVGDGGRAPRPGITADGQEQGRARSDGRRLAPIATGPETPSLAAPATIEPEGPLELPATGTIRFEGQVLSDDDQPLHCEGAVVRVYCEMDDDEGPELLGTASVTTSGRFGIDLTQFAGRSGFGDADEWIYGQLVAPGYHMVSEGGSLVDAVDGVISVQLETSQGGPLLLGRVLDGLGRPVHGAKVRYIEWGRTAQNLMDGEGESDSDGLFGFQVDDGGWVDVVAVHPSHGMGRASGRIEPPNKLLDLGPIVLEPRAVISGVVLGYGGHPIPRLFVELEPVDDESGAVSLGLETGLDGHFRCANLDRVPYRLTPNHHAGDWEDQLIITPDAEGVVLRVPHPTATVSTLGPDGLLLEGSGFSCTGLDGDGRATSDLWVDEREVDSGVHVLVFEAPGTYAIGVHTWVDDVRWSARRVVKIGKEHRALELTLERDDGIPVDFRVTDSAGDPIEKWTLRVYDSMTRMRVASATAQRVRALVEPGRYRVRVTPKSPSLVLQFDAEIEIADGSGEEPQVVTLDGRASGGRVRVSLRASDGLGAQVTAYIRDASTRRRAGNSVRMKVDGSTKELQGPILAGSYELVVTRKAKVGIPAGALHWPFELREGEIKILSVAFPGP